MKKQLLTVFASLALSSTFAQQTELHFALNSGLFSFHGESSNANSVINYIADSKSGYTNNPYGTKSALSYGFSGNLKRVTKKNFILGLDFGYESLRSKVNLLGVYGSPQSPGNLLTTEGSTILSADFINIFPSLGHRFHAKKIAIDLTGGFDIGINLKTQENGKATAVDGTVFTTERDRKTINTEVRPRIQLAANYNKMGVYAGYSYGFMNYLDGFEGGSPYCVSRLIRFGVTYKLL